MGRLVRASAARFAAAGLRALVATVVGCLALGLAAAPAFASGWLPPLDISEAGKGSSEAQVVLDPQGNATAVWRVYKDSNHIIQSAERPAGGSWSEPIDVSDAGGDGELPQVAVDLQGNATVVWDRFNGSDFIIQSAERPAGGSWSEPVDLSAEGQDAFNSQVAVDPQGNATAVWNRSNGSNLIVQSAERPPGGSWSEPVDLSAEGQDAFAPQVAVDPQGNATAVWNRSNGSNQIVQSAERPAGGSWSEPVDLSEVGENAESARVAVDPQGNATAVWYRSNGSNLIIQSAERPPSGSWSEPVDLSDEGRDARMAQVVIGPEGRATAVWQRYNGSNDIVQGAERPAGGSWSEPVDLSRPGRNGTFPKLAVNADGRAMAIWQRFNGSNQIVQSAERPAGGSWSEPVDATEPGESGIVPEVDLDSEGNATALWETFSGGAFIIRATVYDATAPLLRDLSIPAKGTAGQPVPFSVSPLDVWSPLGPTVWAFGDGAAATGTAVSHTYAAPGNYPVTLTSTDAVGNASSAAGAIAIGPAPSSRKGTAFAARIALVKRDRALLRMRCRGGGPCSGLVKLIYARKVKRLVRRQGHREVATRGRRVLIGRKRFAIPAGKRKVLRVKLKRKGKKLLRRARRHRLKVRLTGRGVKHQAVVLKQVQRRRPKHRQH